MVAFSSTVLHRYSLCGARSLADRTKPRPIPVWSVTVLVLCPCLWFMPCRRHTSTPVFSLSVLSCLFPGQNNFQKGSNPGQSKMGCLFLLWTRIPQKKWREYFLYVSVYSTACVRIQHFAFDIVTKEIHVSDKDITLLGYRKYRRILYIRWKRL